MEKQDARTVTYQYMANKKAYVLGFRVRRMKIILIGVIPALVIFKPVGAILLYAVFIGIGYSIDLKQRKMTRNYVQSIRAWYKIKNKFNVQDSKDGGVLKIFRE